MAGHSKWHSIRHKKAANDAKRGKVLTKHAKLLMVLASHDVNPDTNAALRGAIANAKSDGVPKDNIERVLKKASGEGLDGVQYSEQVYEGFGPSGVPVIITSLTDNTNRALTDIRSAFNKNGGNFGSSGSVMFLFDHLGMISVPASGRSEEEAFELVMNAGGDDFELSEDQILITTKFTELGKVRDALEAAGVEIEKAEPIYQAKNPVKLSTAEGERLESFIEALEEVDDTDEVFAGFEIVD